MNLPTNNSLGNLPPPPQGQTGINPNQFSHLPAPPKGQVGMTLAQATANPVTRVASNGFADKPQFTASIGGASTIIPNTLKTIGNIPSDAANIVKTSLNATLGQNEKSAGLVKDIYSSRGAVQGTKDIAGGVADTLGNIAQAPGKFVAGNMENKDLVDKLSPVQDNLTAQRDALVQKIADANKTGADTTHLHLALKYNTDTLSSINSQIGTKEDRSAQFTNDLTNIAKFPIEHPAQIAIAAQTLSPETQATISSTIKPVTAPLQSGADAVRGAVGDVLGGVRNVVSPSPETVATAQMTKLQETISPKINAKEIKLAVKEGRFVGGSDPSLLLDGTPDTIIPSDKTVQVSKTVADNIPGVHDMKPSEIVTASAQKGAQLRDQLTPIMKATPVTPDVVDKITNDWATLQAKQNSDIYMSRSIDLPRSQADFQNNYLMKSKSGNMNDIWQTTQAYDASVPLRVKEANALSSPELQGQKSIWLKQRSILADATHRVSTGLDTTAASDFKTMSDLYLAQANIMSKLTKLGSRESAKIVQWVKDNKIKAGLAGLVVGSVTGANKALGSVVRAVTGF